MNNFKVHMHVHISNNDKNIEFFCSCGLIRNLQMSVMMTVGLSDYICTLMIQPMLHVASYQFLYAMLGYNM